MYICIYVVFFSIAEQNGKIYQGLRSMLSDEISWKVSAMLSCDDSCISGAKKFTTVGPITRMTTLTTGGLDPTPSTN